jgi:hypothetical protein
LQVADGGLYIMVAKFKLLDGKNVVIYILLQSPKYRTRLVFFGNKV